MLSFKPIIISATKKVFTCSTLDNTSRAEGNMSACPTTRQNFTASTVYLCSNISEYITSVHWKQKTGLYTRTKSRGQTPGQGANFYLKYHDPKAFEPPHDKTSKRVCAPSEDSDQPGHPPSLIGVFTICVKRAWFLNYPLCAQWKLWSDWADAQADLSLRWAQRLFCWFCHEADHFL